MTTPSAKADGFLRSPLLQQRLPCLRMRYPPTLATRGSVRALYQCDWRHAPAYDDPISFTLVRSCDQQPGELILLSRCGPRLSTGVPSAIEAGRQEELYRADIEIRFPVAAHCGATPFPRSPKGDGPLECF